MTAAAEIRMMSPVVWEISPITGNFIDPSTDSACMIWFRTSAKTPSAAASSKTSKDDKEAKRSRNFLALDGSNGNSWPSVRLRFFKYYSKTASEEFFSFYGLGVHAPAACDVADSWLRQLCTVTIGLDATMEGMSKELRITQLFDCADVGMNFVRQARREGLPWKMVQGPWMRGGSKFAYYRFLADMAVAYPRTELWHVNMGGRAKWARGRFSRPYALTLHGTDIRENYWQEQHHAAIKADIDGAGQVWYATPDNREKAEQARPDAEYMPIPVDLKELPAWVPAEKPRVFFPSRWDASKGGDAWVQTAADVVDSLKGMDVDIVGLDWGDRAPEVAAMGVQLLPKMAKSDYLLEMSRAHVAVGQIAGILATSELEAMGMGIPTIFADQDPGYPADVATVSVERAQVGDAVRESLRDPKALSGQLASVDYIQRTHSPEVLLPRLISGYEKVLGGTA
ncbi:hypothetical protein [Arthrobacter stackebrandtii]|nr:hypothetical protein [Arthrobacter stackebrandtii]